MEDDRYIRPSKAPFIISRTLPGIPVAAGLLFLSYQARILFDIDLPAAALFGIAAAVIALWSFFAYVRYTKEKYSFQDDSIIMESGSIFSDSRTELRIRNITYIMLSVPFPFGQLFGTGDIKIESAGSGKVEVSLRAIREHKEVFLKIQSLMGGNGFSMKMRKEIYSERPSTIGVFFEVFQRFFGSIFVMLFLAAQLFEDIDSARAALDLARTNTGLAALSIGLIISYLFIEAGFRFLDLRKRNYRIFDDAVTYDEGFMSRNHFVIPSENISDTIISQTLVDKIFGLYDVSVSCPGSKQEIPFRNIADGHGFKSSIDRIISREGRKRQDALAPSQEKPADSKDETEGRTYSASLRMDEKRTIIPYFFALPLFLLFFPLLFFWGFGLVSNVVRMASTKYSIRKDVVEEEYSFLNSSSKEFTYDKIMAVVVKENLFDKWFKTQSIHFWSIGSSDIIRFTNIRKDDRHISGILSNIGIKDQSPIRTVRPGFSLGEMMKAYLPISVPLGAILAALAYLSLLNPGLAIPLIILVVVIALAAWYSKTYHDRSRIDIFKGHLACHKGFIFTSTYFVKSGNIKDISSLSYPFSSYGSVRFNVAGSQQIGTGKRANQTISNSFSLGYITNVHMFHEHADTWLDAGHIGETGPLHEDEAYRTSKPDPRNALVVYVCISIAILPLVVLLPLGIPALYLWYSRISYSLYPRKIVSRSGILFRRKVSVLYSRIDHMSISQNFLNKIFRNGNVEVNTAGSETAEISVRDVPDHTGFYKDIKSHYR